MPAGEELLPLELELELLLDELEDELLLELDDELLELEDELLELELEVDCVVAETQALGLPILPATSTAATAYV